MARPKYNLIGERHGYLVVKSYDSNSGKWVCHCDCGKEILVTTYNLTHDKTKSCGCKSTNRLVDITGKRFGRLVALAYSKEMGAWLCQCDCGKKTYVRYTLLNNGSIKSCGCKGFEDLVGKKFGDWEVLRKGSKPGTFLCRCTCGTEREVYGSDLRSGASKSCGHSTTGYKDLTNQLIGEWLVLGYAGNHTWLCECSCGEIREVSTYSLTSGKSKSCGHSTNRKLDLIGKTFGEWEVIKRVPGHKYLCRCSCGTEREVYINSLLNGLSKSCGCKQWQQTHDTLLERYSDLSSKIDNPREKWQIDTLENPEELKKYLYTVSKELGGKPTPIQLATNLGVNTTTVLRYIHKYNIESLVDISSGTSKQEDEIYRYILSLVDTNTQIIRRDMTVLGNRELDIFIPTKKLAIEFNGTYWHSDKHKKVDYHSKKTLDCAKKGIHLIHIFEYEWNNLKLQVKLKDYLYRLLRSPDNIIYARQLNITEIETELAREFLDTNHLQGFAAAKVYIGAFYNKTLVGLISFGAPRFNSGEEWELIRLAWSSNYGVVGGSERIFNYFLKKYNPKSIVSYCDASKFKGDIYKKLGFNFDKLTPPGYVWVNETTQNVVTRYKSQISRLIDLGIAKAGETEKEAMEIMGYLRIYDSGNYRFIWVKD